MNIIVVFILMLVATLSAFGLFWMEKAKPDKRTWKQVLILGLCALVASLFCWVLRRFAETPLGWVYILGQVLFLCMGILHVNLLYKQMWSIRDRNYWERDSLAGEAAFTAFVGHLCVVLFMVPYYFLTKREGQETANFWALFLPFLVPFIVEKSLDLLHQIPFRDYQYKWTYQLTELDETRWNWDNTLIVGFQVIDAFEHEDHWFPKKAHFTIRAPRDQMLTQVYRLGLRKYHERDPSVPVQDIGYEVSPPPFWWLFYIKFSLFKPRTWFPATRYLNPDSSIAANQLQNGDLVTARRIPFY